MTSRQKAITPLLLLTIVGASYLSVSLVVMWGKYLVFLGR